MSKPLVDADDVPRCPRCHRRTSKSLDGRDFCEGCADEPNRCRCPDLWADPGPRTLEIGGRRLTLTREGWWRRE